jgi:hypothetical protein
VLYYINIILIEGYSINDESNLLELLDKYVDISFSIETFIELLFDYEKNHPY